jgi:hypothetical protein
MQEIDRARGDSWGRLWLAVGDLARKFQVQTQHFTAPLHNLCHVICCLLLVKDIKALRVRWVTDKHHWQGV